MNNNLQSSGGVGKCENRTRSNKSATAGEREMASRAQGGNADGGLTNRPLDCTPVAYETINKARARHTANCTNMDDAEPSATISESSATHTAKDSGDSGALKTRWRGSRCGRLFSDVSSPTDGVPIQRPKSRRTELVSSGTSRLTSDSFHAFERSYVLRLMVWTFLLGFAWATITWLARVTHGQNVVASGTNSVVWTNFTNFRVYTSNTHTAIRSNWVYQVVDSHARIDSNFEPVVVRTNGRWRITFKP